MKSKQDVSPVSNRQILSRYWGGCTIQDLTNYVAFTEGPKKREARARVEKALYEEQKRK